MAESSALTFAHQHDPSVSESELGAALRRLRDQGLIKVVQVHGDRHLEPTLRGFGLLHALHDARRELEKTGKAPSYARARDLYEGTARPNPSQASFSWAGDPRQLVIDFSRPVPSEPPPPQAETEPSGRSAPRARARRAPRPARAKPIYGAPIVLLPSGEISDKALQAWCVRWAMGAGVKPALNPDSGMAYGSAVDLLDRWAHAWQKEAATLPVDWRRFLAAWKREKKKAEESSTAATFEDLLRDKWIHIAATYRETATTEAQRRHDLTVSDADTFAKLAQAQYDLERAESAANLAEAPMVLDARRAARSAWLLRDEAWLLLLNRWLDRTWLPPFGRRASEPNPSAFGSSSGAERAQRRARMAQLRSDIAEQRRQIQRARSERTSSLRDTTEKAKRTRRKVTEDANRRRAEIRAEAQRRIERARAKISELRALREAYGAKPKGQVRRTVAEQREDVERQIESVDPRLVELWRRSGKGRFSGTAHEQAEKFLEWVEGGEGQQAYWDLVEATMPTSEQYAAEQAAYYASEGAA